MLEIGLNVILSAAIISTALWVAKTNPALGGFIVSLPLSTLIVLAFSKGQNEDVQKTFALAKSIFVAVPATLLFFVPFLLADKFKLSFWMSYLSGFALLMVSYFVHRSIMSYWLR